MERLNEQKRIKVFSTKGRLVVSERATRVTELGCLAEYRSVFYAEQCFRCGRPTGQCGHLGDDGEDDVTGHT